MCGIAGIIDGSGKSPEAHRLARMVASLAHRGPDDDEMKIMPGAGLGFRRLSIIDVAGSRQPLANEDEGLWLVANGEIYNYRQLRDELIGCGHVFRTDGDIEVALHGYEEWGIAVLQRLRGMFGLAIWDVRARQLLLARDRLGIKPVYYASAGQCVVFGSELKALIASELVPRDIDWPAIDLYMSLAYIPAPSTCYRHVRKLLPGYYLRAQNGRVDIERYWAPPPVRRALGIDEEAESLRATLREAVALHRQSDVPLGFFLSGGLDSSSVVAMAAEQGPRVRTFAVGFETGSHNELPYAREVARHFGCEHSEHMVRPDAAGLAPQLAVQFDEPFADSSAIPMFHICEVARKSVKVVVGGDGGDELLAGYDWTRRQLLIEQWQRVPGLLRAPATALLASHGQGPGTGGRLARFLADATVSPQDGFSRRIACMTSATKRLVYGPQLQSAYRPEAMAALLHPFFAANTTQPVDAMNRFDLQVYLPDDDLCKVDRVTMMHSLEGRVPLLDHVVAEQLISLPMSYKCAGRHSKLILKRAMEALLPPSILRQRKHGFAIPVQQWMRGPLYRDVSRILLEGEAQKQGFLHREGMRQLLLAHASGRANHGHALWTLLMFELWLRLCLEPRASGHSLRGVRLADL